MSRRSPRRRNPYRFVPLRTFILTFLLTFMSLTAVGAPILLTEQDAPPPATPYSPDWDDRMNLLCAVRAEDGDYLTFFLLGLSPFDERIYVAPLPESLIAAAGDRQNSLGGFAGYGGTKLCAEALMQSYSLRVDRVATLTTLQLRDLVNVAGGVRARLQRAYVCVDGSGARRTYAAGEQTLDGQAFVDMTLYAETGTELERLLLGGRMIAGLIREKLTPRQSATENPLTEILPYMTTDLSYADYLARADALDQVAIYGGTEMTVIGGSFSYEGRRFSLSAEAQRALRETYGERA